MKEIDLKKLETAIIYTDRIANGKNPVTNKDVYDDTVIHNPNVIRCMFFIRDILQEVRDNNGIISGSSSRARIQFPLEVVSDFRYEKDLSISQFVAQLKDLCENPKAVKLSPQIFTDWLRKNGYLAQITNKFTGENETVITPEGEAFGLYTEERSSGYGRSYHVIIYTRKAQEQLAELLKEGKLEK